jgi:micrococcal nuclease
VGRPLAGIELRELEALRDQLDAGRLDQEARLAGIEARKDELFADGVARPDLRGAGARAGQIANLEAEANQVAHLLQITHKQRLLLDHLIWLRENLAAIERLRAAAPGAVPPDWPALLDATAGVSDEDQRLDQLNARLEPAVAGVMSPVAGAGGREWGIVVSVLDGAAIELAGGQAVRYIGVDSPQLRNVLGRPDAGAQEALEANRRLVDGRQVRLEADRLNADPDGALWRYVYVAEAFVNAELLRQGVVLHVSRYPNNRLEPVLVEAERDARRHRRGLWRSSPAS